MAHGQNGITNGVHEGVNGATKAKVLPKSFDSIENTIEAFGAFDDTHWSNHQKDILTCNV